MEFWRDATHASFWLELARGDLATWIQLTPYLYAAIEGVHLVGIAFFFGPIFLLDLRLLGLLPRLVVGSTGRFLLSITAPAFAVVAVSGILMFISSADRYAASPVFIIKMAAIVMGGTNALVFHVAAWGRVDVWGEGRRTPWIAHTAAIVSVLVWMSVIVLGRWMGYELRKPPEMDFDTLPWLDSVGELGAGWLL